ncbi:hypothetical protein T11_18644 [Trichinella zimbabwensis]|uniref:Uncharacterized protein n=1 Tax=Trichinella zimbabwensis TaxID=268475 RepID=A0A0V1HNB2_9BILA|nr:hypothetical protein T11_18644 [Trichinella zimbabwensis]
MSFEFERLQFAYIGQLWKRLFLYADPLANFNIQLYNFYKDKTFSRAEEEEEAEAELLLVQSSKQRPNPLIIIYTNNTAHA